MPQTRPSTARPGLPPVPVGIFLPAPHQPPQGTPVPATTCGDWCGVSAGAVARLIATYTTAGDLVGDFDGHPGITAAARYLGRRTARLCTTAGGYHREPAVPPVRPLAGRRRVALLLAGLPRSDVEGLDLPATAHAMGTWRALLRPGGYLLVALATTGPGEGRGSGRATLIAAAAAAGLSWQQELLVVRVPLPEYEPRAMPHTAATTPAALADGRHEPVHVKLLAFQHLRAGSDV
jgi:hypothetical protein